jgi:hypothetical protein
MAPSESHRDKQPTAMLYARLLRLGAALYSSIQLAVLLSGINAQAQGVTQKTDPLRMLRDATASKRKNSRGGRAAAAGSRKGTTPQTPSPQESYLQIRPQR